MDRNSIISAPQIRGVSGFYQLWKQGHIGSFEEFLDFMATPSPERDQFIKNHTPEERFYGNVFAQILGSNGVEES